MKNRWKPNVTVAAIIERNGKFLLVEEKTQIGLRLNNPAGHIEPGESLAQACTRETLEETAFDFTPTQLVGIYMSRFEHTEPEHELPHNITYLRFAFCGTIGPHWPQRALDTGVVRTLWLTPEEIRASQALHRSPMLLTCVEDYLQGQRFPLSLITTDASVYALPA